MCTYINFFLRTSLHSADSKCQILHRLSKNGSECTSLCAPKGSKFSKNLFTAVVYRMDCSCAPMFRFFSVASDGATTERQI